MIDLSISQSAENKHKKAGIFAYCGPYYCLGHGTTQYTYNNTKVGTLGPNEGLGVSLYNNSGYVDSSLTVYLLRK